MALIRQNNELYEQVLQPAISPAGMKQAGGNEDQAKMAGTPAQKKPVLHRQVSEQPKNLQRAESEQEKAAREKASKVRSASNLAERVKNKIEIKKLENSPEFQVTRTEKELKAIPGLEGISQEGVTTISNIVASEDDLQTKAEKLAQLGVADPYSYLSNVYGIQVQDATQAAAVQASEQYAGIDPTFESLTDEDYAELGFTNSDEVAALVGVNPDQLDNMTINEFQALIDNMKESEYSRLSALEAQYNILPPGSAQRQQIAAEINQLKGTGVGIAESNIMEEVDELAGVDKITLDSGEELDMNELFQEEEFKELIDDYLNKGIDGFPEGEIFDKIKENVNAYRDDYKDKLDMFSESKTEYENTQTEYDDIIGKDTELFKEIFGDDIIDDNATRDELEELKTKIADLDADEFLKDISDFTGDPDSIVKDLENLKEYIPEEGLADVNNVITKYKSLIYGADGKPNTGDELNGRDLLEVLKSDPSLRTLGSEMEFYKKSAESNKKANLAAKVREAEAERKRIEEEKRKSDEAEALARRKKAYGERADRQLAAMAKKEADRKRINILTSKPKKSKEVGSDKSNLLG